MMKVLITGGSGKIGRRLINRLASHNMEIRVLTRKGNLFSPNGAESVVGALTDPASLFEPVRGAELIIHLAAVTHTKDSRLYWQVNALGTKNLIKAAQTAEVRRFILVSTRAIDPSGGAYSQSKLAAEEMVRNSGISWVVLRLGEVYGNTEGGMIQQLIGAVKKWCVVPVIPCRRSPLTPIHIDDVIYALEKVVSPGGPSNRVYLLAGPETFSFKELVQAICHYYGLTRLKIYCPIFLIRMGFKLFGLVPGQSLMVPDQLARLLSPKSSDISLAKKELQFNPIRFF